MCFIHFREEDYRQPSARTQTRRKEKLRKECSDFTPDVDCSGRTRLLVPTAVPSIFPSFPPRAEKRKRSPPRHRDGTCVPQSSGRLDAHIQTLPTKQLESVPCSSSVSLEADAWPERRICCSLEEQGERSARVAVDDDSAASATEPMDSSRLASELRAASAESALAERVSLLEEELSVAKAEISALKAHIFCAERILEDQSQQYFRPEKCSWPASTF